MAKVEFQHPIAAISGKMSSNERIVMRTRNGRTHTYLLTNPYKGESSPARQRTISAFSRASQETTRILADAQQVAQWQEKYTDYCRNCQQNPVGNKTYSTLRGFIIASLLPQFK